MGGRLRAWGGATSSRDPISVDDDARLNSFATVLEQGGRITPAQQRELDAASRREWSPAPAAPSSTQQPSAPAQRRSVPRPDTSERAVRQQAMWNRALRRELTNDEWARLSEPQRNQVRFNTELLTRYDLDQQEDPTGRGNTKALYSELGLDEEKEAEVNGRLGIGTGTTVRYGDLFTKSGRATTERGLQTPQPSRDDTSRRELASSISEKISEYIGVLRAGQTDAAPAVSPSQFQFGDELARKDYEVSFTNMLYPDKLATYSWPQIQQHLVASGYNPADFKAYALERIKMMPTTEGQSTPADIQSWFG